MTRAVRAPQPNRATALRQTSKFKFGNRLRRSHLLIAICSGLVFIVFLFDVPVRWLCFSARRALDESLPYSALRWIQRTRLLGNDNIDARLLETEAYLQLSMNSKALTSLQLALQYGLQAEIASAFKDMVLAQRGDFAAAERLMNQHAGVAPARPTLEAIVRCALLNDRFDWVAMVLDKWQQQFPRDAAARYYRGRTHEIHEDWAKALVEYGAALVLQPKFAKASFRSGIVLTKQQQFFSGEQMFRKCAVPPYTQIAMIEVANCLWELGQNAEAEKVIDEHGKLGPESLQEQYMQLDEFVDEDRAALVAARVKDSQNEPQAAIKLLKQVLDYNHRNFEARNILISCLRRLEKNAEADQVARTQTEMLECRRRCLTLRIDLSIDSENIQKRCELAELYWKCESLGEAQLELNAIFAREPTCKQAHRIQSQIYAEKGRFSQEFQGLAAYHTQLSQ